MRRGRRPDPILDRPTKRHLGHPHPKLSAGFDRYAKPALFSVSLSCDHRYLEISELVDFITRAVEREFRIPLRERHFNGTQPCLAKFSTDGVRKINLAYAVAYLDHSESGGAAGEFRGNTTSLRGEPVPSLAIEAVIPVTAYGRRWTF